MMQSLIDLFDFQRIQIYKLKMQSKKGQIIVIGASRGIGGAVAQHFVQKGDHVISISRNQPIAGEWIQADISSSEGIKVWIKRCSAGIKASTA